MSIGKITKHIAVYLFILHIDVYIFMCYNFYEVIIMYDEKSKERTMKYLKEKRDKLTLNLPQGAKDKYKLHAESKGKSLTALIIELLEKDIKEGVI